MKRNAFIRHYTRQTIALFKTFLVKTFFQQENHCTISDDERKLCEALLTAAEYLESLKNMESNKTPERTEFQLNIIKSFGMTLRPFFSPLLTLPMLKAFSPYHRGEDRLLTLIPKKDKSLCYIKNWRPASRF